MRIGPFALGGYRSFGASIQRFPRLSKLNLFIGPNNCGKSNVLRFLHEVFPSLGSGKVKLGPLDSHFPNQVQFKYGVPVSLRLDSTGKALEEFIAFISKKLNSTNGSAASHALRVLKRKAELDGTEDAWFTFGQGRELLQENWADAFNLLDDREIYTLWCELANKRNGSRNAHWFPESLKRLEPEWNVPGAINLVPAIRQISSQAEVVEGWLSGSGLIERLSKLQNPDVLSQADKVRFHRINDFLRSVTENGSATIEIPHARDTIVVHIDGKALPLESLGTGIHEVVILASVATILDDTVICVEEPELHLNPVLQKKLVRYLIDATNNQYFITTHSAALMDAPGAEIYHLELRGGQTNVERVTSDRHRSLVCESLGYHPSDLLQANCIVWVEGPSDRIYLKFWLEARAPDLQEGIHFSIMFYGGRLASHLTAEDLGDCVSDFISLRRLNRRSAILIDSDFRPQKRVLNETKARLVEEFNKGPGHAWITAGREIENYISGDGIGSAIESLMPSVKARAQIGKFDRALEVARGGKTATAPKVAVARFIAEKFRPDESRHDLRLQLDRMEEFIRSSNPKSMHASA